MVARRPRSTRKGTGGIVTPAEFRAIRRRLGLSQSQLAATLKVASARTVRKWENAERDIPGPARVLMWLFDRHPQLVQIIR